MFDIVLQVRTKLCFVELVPKRDTNILDKVTSVSLCKVFGSVTGEAKSLEININCPAAIDVCSLLFLVSPTWDGDDIVGIIESSFEKTRGSLVKEEIRLLLVPLLLTLDCAYLTLFDVAVQ